MKSVSMKQILLKLFRAGKLLHPQVFVSFVATGLILFVPQITDLVRVFVEEVHIVHTLLALAGIWLLAFSIWVSGRWLTIRAIDLGSEATDMNFWEKWLPRILGASPLLALSFLNARLIGEVSNDQSTKYILGFYASILLLSSVGFIYLTFTRKKDSNHRPATRDSFIAGSRGPFNWPDWTYWVFFGFSLIMVATLVNNASFTQHLGTLFLAFSFMAFLVLFLTFLIWKSKKHNFSYLGFFALLAMVIAWADWSDNHQLALSGSFETDKLGSAETFQQWLEDTPRQTNGDDSKIPVYLVAAQGGGIFAAFHAAMTLATIEDLCPGFSDHLFAISSVSGGSLGSALFVDLVRDSGTKPTPEATGVVDYMYSFGNENRHAVSVSDELQALPHCVRNASSTQSALSEDTSSYFRSRVWNAFTDDWLSPVVARTLFAEPLLTFFPLPCSYSWKSTSLFNFCQSFDQAKALEASLVRSANKVNDSKNALKKGISNYYQDSDRLPNLLINTADAMSGARVVMAPFTVTGAGMAHFDEYVSDKREPTIVEAAVLSARFPFFTQAGFIKDKAARQHLCGESLDEICTDGDDELKVRFVDGGYSDNSGIQTLEDLLVEVRAETVNSDVSPEFHIITLTGIESNKLGGYSFNELGTPIKAMFKMWSKKAKALRSEFVEQNNTYPAELDTRKGNIPLGWRLSKQSRKDISTQILCGGFGSLYDEC